MFFTVSVRAPGEGEEVRLCIRSQGVGASVVVFPADAQANVCNNRSDWLLLGARERTRDVQVREQDLLPDGSKRLVTEDNKHRYVQLLVEWYVRHPHAYM